jgi:hypothetical protein
LKLVELPRPYVYTVAVSLTIGYQLMGHNGDAGCLLNVPGQAAAAVDDDSYPGVLNQ